MQNTKLVSLLKMSRKNAPLETGTWPTLEVEGKETVLGSGDTMIFRSSSTSMSRNWRGNGVVQIRKV